MAAPTIPQMRRFSANLVSLSRRYRQAIDSGLAGLSMTHTPALAVMMIGRAPDGMRQGALADQLGVDAASAVPLVYRLVRSGLVERRIDSTDRRARMLHLTDAGMTLAAQVEERTGEIRQHLLGDIDADDLVVATRVLDQLQAAMLRIGDKG
jgi:MarR family transcriptional regulator, transcriptional regulator for hemolysin